MGQVSAPPREFMNDWGITDLLERHSRLRVKVNSHGSTIDGIEITGSIDFFAQKPGYPEVTDSFGVRIQVPNSYPIDLPLVYPIDNRIPSKFHRLACGAFCLGSPTRQKLALSKSANLVHFIDLFVIPYLYSFAIVEKGLEFPFGELAHGRRGLIDDFKSLFSTDSDKVAKEFVYLTSRPKRKANCRPCPCDSGLRLGKCKIHHSLVTSYRKSLGRLWFQDQYQLITGGTTKRI